MSVGKDERYVVSAINRDLLKKGIIVILAIVVLVGLFSFLVKPKYFFCYNGETITLCEGRIGWLDGHPVTRFKPMAMDAEDAKAITGKKFSTIESARKDLLAFAESSIQKRRAQIREMEQKLATQYRSLLKEYLIAKEMGAKTFDKQIKALSSWLEAFGQAEAESPQKSKKE